jgi:hypothetical protein
MKKFLPLIFAVSVLWLGMPACRIGLLVLASFMTTPYETYVVVIRNSEDTRQTVSRD